MHKHIARLLLIVFCSSFSVGCTRGTQTHQGPLGPNELMALVAGAALPENLVAEIHNRGLCFHVDVSYRSEMEKAGADPKVLAALDSAKVVVPNSSQEAPNKDFLAHISNAAKLMNSKDYPEATTQLDAATKASSDSPDSEFVRGQLFRLEQQWPEAAEAYSEVLGEDQNFPEVHTKLSFILIRLGDYEESLREAKAALAITPDNPEAHKFAGLALTTLRKYDAALVEFKEALRLKPDYETAHLDMALAFTDMRDWNDALAQFQKAIALDPDDIEAHYNLGYCWDQTGDFQSAIREYREVKRIDPHRFDGRQNLAADLLNHGFAADAVLEFRDMEKIFPNAEMCHVCLAMALFRTWDFKGAEAEYSTAIQLDPTDATPLVGLGGIQEEEKHYDQALENYRHAMKVNPKSWDAHLAAGRVLIAKKDFAGALEDLKQAEYLQPSQPVIHDYYAQACLGSGNTDAAISEFKQAMALDPKAVQVMLRFAAALEKKGDWVASNDEYRKAALTDAGVDWRGKITRSDELNPQNEYKYAQERLSQHIASLKAVGKSSEAAQLEASLKNSQAAPSISEKLYMALQAGAADNRQRDFEAAKRDFKQAVELADKIQPHDQRLVSALDHLGNEYFGEDPAAAEAAYERELKVSEEIYGPQSANLTPPLESLGRNALKQKDYATAEKFFFRAVDLNEKVYGEGSDKVANSLLMAASVYIVQKDYAKAETYLVRALNIDESLFGRDGIDILMPLFNVCTLYDKWGKPDKLEPCDRQLITVLEKQYGANSPQLVSTLTSEAQVLRTMGRPKEAESVEDRLASIRSATMVRP